MTHRHASRGFSLVELLVALAVGGLVMVFVFVTFIRSQRGTRQVTEQIDNRQNARAAMQILERDLRMAGSGWSRIDVEGCFGGNPISVPPISTGYGGDPAANDTIGMIGGWDASTKLRLAMKLTTDPIKIESGAGLSVNDFVVITNGKNAHLFQITGITGTPPDLAHSTASPYNAAGGHFNWPSGGYAKGAAVHRASWVSYSVDTSVIVHPKLIRREAGRGDQLVAYDVSQFKVSYLLQDESTTRSPADTAIVDRVTPVVCTRMVIPGRPAQTDSAAASIRPRSF